mgnify:CR=1 FL=1
MRSNRLYRRSLSITKFSFLLLLILFSLSSTAQLGGNGGFQFLNLNPSARLMGLGRHNISLYDKDVSNVIANPAFLDSTMSGDLSINYQNYVADINYGLTTYAHHFDKIGTFAASMLFANYGRIIRADEIGNQLGNVPVNDYALIVSYGRSLDSLFSFGTNAKIFYSTYDAYNASGIALDATGAYYNPRTDFAIGASISNFGIKFSDYTESSNSTFPTEAKLGLTKKLKHAPFRLSLTLTNLQKWDLTYDDPNAEKQFDPETFEELPPKEPSFFEKGLRHVNLGAEIILSKSFNVQLGFDYRTRRELAVAARSGLVGFSTGVMFGIKKFRCNYSVACYHLSGTTHNFSVSTNINRFFK